MRAGAICRSVEYGGRSDATIEKRLSVVHGQVRPGTGTTAPVVTLFSGDARKAMVAAISSGFGHAA
jgi:hypothetical protein